jgi:DNA-binding transcriptional LysR family regulator
MDIDPRRMRVLRAVALRGGIMDAARLLHLSPSAVSQQIRQLEREVGIPVLDRSRRRVELTPAGRLLAARADRIEAELAEARRELAMLSGRVSGPVVAAAFPTAIRHLLVPAIGQLARTHPDVRPSVVDLEGPEALHELGTGGIDVLITERDGGHQESPPPGVAVRALLDDDYRVVVPAGWEASVGSIGDLAGGPWIAGPAGSACVQALDRLAGEYRFSPRRAHVCLEFPAVLALVAGGLGAAVVPLLALADVPADAIRVTAIPSVGFRRLSALFRTTPSGPEPVVAAMLGALERAAEPHRSRPRTPGRSGRDQQHAAEGGADAGRLDRPEPFAEQVPGQQRGPDRVQRGEDGDDRDET